MQNKIQSESKDFSEQLKRLKLLQQQVEEKDKEILQKKENTPLETVPKKDSFNYALEFKEQVGKNN